MLLSATVFGMGPFGVLEVYLARAPSQRNKTCTRTCLVDALFCSRHSEEAGVAGSDSFSTVVTMFQQSYLWLEKLDALIMRQRSRLSSLLTLLPGGKGQIQAPRHISRGFVCHLK